MKQNDIQETQAVIIEAMEFYYDRIVQSEDKRKPTLVFKEELV